MRVRGLSDRELDRLIAAAEKAFAAAISKAFAAATKHLALAAKTSVTAALTPVGGMDVGDVAIAQQVWQAEVPGLTEHIAVAFGRSATAVGGALYADSGLHVPLPVAPGALQSVEDMAIVSVAPGGGVPVVARLAIDRAARDHLAGATNRLVNAGDAMWMDIRSELTAGFTAGEGIRDITNRLRDTADVSRRRAETIARTEVISASNAGAMAGARAIPEIAPATKTWLATGDGRTRPSHREADGQTVGLDEPFVVGGALLDYPGADGPAEEVINCRCTVTLGDPADALDPDNLEEELAAPSDFTPAADPFAFTQTTGEVLRRADALNLSGGDAYREFQTVERGQTYYGGYHTDEPLNAIARARGIDGVPTVMSTADADALVAQGWTETWRGFGNQRAFDQFLTGEYESGPGLFGSGFYTGPEATANTYASSDSGRAMRILIPPDARVVVLDRSGPLADVLDEVLVESAGADTPGSVAASDPGRWVALQGGDVVQVPRADGGDFLVLLNRSNLVIDGGTTTPMSFRSAP